VNSVSKRGAEDADLQARISFQCELQTREQAEI